MTTAAEPVDVLVGFPLPDRVKARLEAVSPRFRFRYLDRHDQALLDEAAAADVEVLLSSLLPTDTTRTPRLRWLQVLSAGVDHLADRRPWPDGITLTNARGVYAGPIGQYVIGAILRVCEGVDARRVLQVAHDWPEDQTGIVGRQVRGLTLTIIGYGAIGREIARVADALGMRVIAVKARPEIRTEDAFRLPGTGDPDGSIPDRIVGLDEIAGAVADADFVSVTLPLTSASRHLVGEHVLAAMRPEAWLINTGRGPVIDEAALLVALRSGAIGGAVLDVFDEEPLPADHPFWEMPNVILTPHIAGAFAHDTLADLLVENLARYSAGRPLLNLVEPDRGY